MTRFVLPLYQKANPVRSRIRPLSGAFPAPLFLMSSLIQGRSRSRGGGSEGVGGGGGYTGKKWGLQISQCSPLMRFCSSYRDLNVGTVGTLSAAMKECGMQKTGRCATDMWVIENMKLPPVVPVLLKQPTSRWTTLNIPGDFL